MESPLGMSRHPQKPVTVQRAWSEMLFQTKNESLRLCMCVGQGQRTAAYALCIINEHAERNHNGCSALHNASLSNAGVRGHVWLCAWLPRTKTNKESFEGAGGYKYITGKQKKSSWLQKTQQSVTPNFCLI